MFGPYRQYEDGLRFHYLETIGTTKAPSKKRGNRRRWVCQCDCGTIVEVRPCDLYKGDIRSCGCKHWDKMRGSEAVYSFLRSMCKTSAKSRGLSFTLSKREFTEIVSQNCRYCGDPPIYRALRKMPKFATSCTAHGLDRIDNSRGYELDNVVSCCRMCNLWKNKFTVQQFLDHAMKVATHSTAKAVAEAGVGV